MIGKVLLLPLSFFLVAPYCFLTPSFPPSLLFPSLPPSLPPSCPSALPIFLSLSPPHPPFSIQPILSSPPLHYALAPSPRASILQHIVLRI